MMEIDHESERNERAKFVVWCGTRIEEDHNDALQRRESVQGPESAGFHLSGLLKIDYDQAESSRTEQVFGRTKSLLAPVRPHDRKLGQGDPVLRKIWWIEDRAPRRDPGDWF
jgi:hypothetical protein